MPEPFDTGGPMPSMCGSTAPKRCYLLELPGELRNRIYDFAIEEPITYFSPRLQAWLATELESIGITKQKPLYQGLTQSCRQLRKEYLPLYVERLDLHVCHVDLDEFMDAGCPFLPRDNDGRTFGNMFVDCRSMRPLGPDGIRRRDGTSIDIIFFLTYCSNNPGLRVQGGFNDCECCRPDWLGLRKVFNALCNIARRPSLAKWIEEDVYAIDLEFLDALWIEMRSEKMQQWMIDLEDGKFTHDITPEYEAWKRDTDMDLDDSHGYVVFSC